ncbi:MAG: sulfurtransferase-like selenium metabolism protein YedF [Thermodesulfovibrionales bacterium]|nr:sulfurtransferase-like selenium metabolism protein YedF [Thermodesulfovibrionales bacterium]
MVIDARGFACPKPVLMLEDELNKISEGSIEILVDNEASVNNIKRFCAKRGMFAEDSKIENYWKVKVVKGFNCQLPQDNVTDKTKKELFIIIATDTMGKDETLGRILMKAYLETMMVYNELPDSMFFMNTGVKLTTTDDEIVTIIKQISEKGVEIFTCGTCLKYFNLEANLKVGLRGTTNHVVEGIKDYKKTVWIG